MTIAAAIDKGGIGYLGTRYPARKSIRKAPAQKTPGLLRVSNSEDKPSTNYSTA